MEITVLSLFDGMSCGQIALNQLGLQPAHYYAAEIKKHAIKVTLANYPDTIEIGDVRKVSYRNGVLFTEAGEYEAGRIDLLIGGSPCQDLSIQMADRKGLAGDKSSLFWEYVRILKEVKPRFFLLENVASMPTHDAAIITKTMGVAGVCINSALVSAQSRNRYYWTNIPGTGSDLFNSGIIEQPADRKIMAKDILEHGHTDRKKFFCLTARGGGGVGRISTKTKSIKPTTYRSSYYTDTEKALTISYMKTALLGCFHAVKWNGCKQCRTATQIASAK